MLKVCQHRYEAMVNGRNSRDPKSSADLQVLRQKLRVQLYAYCSAVGSMLDGTPESAKVVAKALRPILVVRAQVKRKLAGMAPSENDLELVEPASSDTEVEPKGELDDGVDQE